MATLKELNIKIASLKQTKKITSAMKLIATTRFNKTLGVMYKAREYVTALAQLAKHIEASSEDLTDNFLIAHTPQTKRTVHFIVFTSDRGLCGSFNNAVIKAFEKILNAHAEEECYVDFIGKRGYEYFKNSTRIKHARELPNFAKNPTYDDTVPYADEYIQLFKQGKRQRIVAVYNAFISTISQEPQTQCLLPFSSAETAQATPPAVTRSSDVSDKNDANVDVGAHYFIFEPNMQTLIQQYLEAKVRFQLYELLVQSVTGEHAARMTAMDNATRNCDDLIDSSTLERNRVRQAAITTELTEIISGAEAAT